MEVNQLLVAQLLMVAVDGNDFVLFGHKSETEWSCKPQLGFFELIETKVIVFLVSDKIIFFSLSFFTVFKRAAGAVAESYSFEQLTHLSELDRVSLLASLVEILVYEKFVFSQLVW